MSGANLVDGLPLDSSMPSSAKSSSDDTPRAKCSVSYSDNRETTSWEADQQVKEKAARVTYEQEIREQIRMEILEEIQSVQQQQEELAAAQQHAAPQQHPVVIEWEMNI
ncbi:unnamed protein product [Caenorhabditis nigoni]